VAARRQGSSRESVELGFGDRVRFVSFALDNDPALRKYLESNPFKYEIVPESRPIARSFGRQNFPTHLIVDAAGRIVWTSGSDDDRIERLRAMVSRLIARGDGHKPSEGEDPRMRCRSKWSHKGTNSVYWTGMSSRLAGCWAGEEKEHI
jgi:hypothetical protein